VIVYYNEASLPSSRTKGEKPDYDKLSELIVGEDVRGLPDYGPDASSSGGKVNNGENYDYIVYTIIYGAVPFALDTAVLRQISSRTSEITVWKKPVRVFPWGNAAKFHGVLTTLPTYQLIGWGLEKLGDSYPLPERESSNRFVSIRPVQVMTQVEWYKKVVIDARAQPFAFLNPISRYSPISNLPFLSKTGLTFSQQRVENEEGILVGNMVRVNREESGLMDEFVPVSDILETSLVGDKVVPTLTKVEKEFVLPSSSSQSGKFEKQTFVDVESGFDPPELVNQGDEAY